MTIVRLFRAFILGITLTVPTQQLSPITHAQDAKPSVAEVENTETKAAIKRSAGLRWKSLALQQNGDIEGALAAATEALKVRTEVFGEGHPETFPYLNSFAGILFNAGHEEQALTVSTRLLKLSKEVFGNQDPRILTYLMNHASLIWSLGRLDEAKALYAEGMPLILKNPENEQKYLLSYWASFARLLTELGDMDRAEQLYSEALFLNRMFWGEDHENTRDAIYNYADFLKSSQRTEESRRIFSTHLRQLVAQHGTRHPTTLNFMRSYVEVLREANRASAALDLSDQILSLTDESVDGGLAAKADQLFTRAMVLENQAKWADAASAYSEGYDIIRELSIEERGPLLRYWSQYYLVQTMLGGDTEAELAHFAEGLILHRETFGEYDERTQKILLSNAYMSQNRGHLQQAEELFSDALRVSRVLYGSEHPETLRRLSQYAVIVSKLGRLEESAEHFSESLRLGRKVFGESNDYTIAAMGNYGSVLSSLGRTAETEELLRRAYELARALHGELSFEAISKLGNYAVQLHKLDRPAEAAPLFAKALELRRNDRFLYGTEMPEYAADLIRYAEVLADLDRIEEAEPIAAEAVALHRNVFVDPVPGAIPTLTIYADILKRLGRIKQAEEVYEEALKKGRKMLGPHHQYSLAALSSLASMKLSSGHIEHASAMSRELVQALRLKAKNQYQTGVRGLEQRDREAGSRRRSERLLSDSLWATLVAEGDRVSNWATEPFEALQLASAGTTSQAVSEAAATRFASNLGLQKLVMERQALAREWPAVEAKLLEQQTGGENTEQARVVLRERIREIELQMRRIDAVLAREAPQYFAILEQQAVKLDALREVLSDDEAIMMLVPTERGTHSMVVNKNAIEWSRSEIDKEQLTEKIATFRKGMEVAPGGGLPLFDFDLAHELYSELVSPVEDALAGKRRVFVVADGALSRIPLGTLITAQLVDGETVENSTVVSDSDNQSQRATVFGGIAVAETRTNNPADFLKAQWLADRYALVQLPSVQSLVYIRTYGAADEGLSDGAAYTGFGDPVLAGHASLRSTGAATSGAVDAAGFISQSRTSSGSALMDPDALRNLSSLPGTRTELEMVQALLGASVNDIHLGEAMTEKAIRSADLSKTRILHLATHGLTSEEGGLFGEIAEPGLVFTPPRESHEGNDGYLTASEVVSLDLTSAEWVILSACNTAAPSGQPGETGLSGLAQSFFYAGAESLLVSHWPVFDSVAPLLTAETLSRTQSGTPRAEAFQLAMQEVRKTNPHPAAWAPFVLVGEGR